MSRNQNASEPEPHDGHDRQPSGRDREPNDREPPDGGESIGRAHPPRDDDDDGYEGVTRRMIHLPMRDDPEDAHEDDRDEDDRDDDVEDDANGEQELAEADMLEVRDLDDERAAGPDA